MTQKHSNLIENPSPSFEEDEKDHDCSSSSNDEKREDESKTSPQNTPVPKKLQANPIEEKDENFDGSDCDVLFSSVEVTLYQSSNYVILARFRFYSSCLSGSASDIEVQLQHTSEKLHDESIIMESENINVTLESTTSITVEQDDDCVEEIPKFEAKQQGGRKKRKKTSKVWDVVQTLDQKTPDGKPQAKCMYCDIVLKYDSKFGTGLSKF
ncbi:hypothetical protein CCACVL1_07890 [Corchorus capsularis]|uniref:Zinc finger, BED-type n=1 Tax=Corchorus capsularis TaxID=210143 RepID=A0A1R3J3E9_COCAP|nr:hypothetical protein CCACVL1_07890 [Corchorus capsularis]